MVSDYILNITDGLSLPVLHLDANSTEFDPDSQHPVVRFFFCVCVFVFFNDVAVN